MSQFLSVLPVHALSTVIRPANLVFARLGTAVHSLSGVGIGSTVSSFFKPSMHSRSKAPSTSVPFKSNTRLPVKRTAENIRMLNRMAFELDTQQPQMAAELRLLAAQG